MLNHGFIATGVTVAEAFDELYHFEKSCEVYINAL